MADWQQVPPIALRRPPSGATSGLALVWLALPLLIVPRARAWWIRRAGWTFVVFGVAVAVLCLSSVVGTAVPVHNEAYADQPATDGYEPDPRFFLPALGVFAFASMHLLPPLRRTRDVR